MIRNKISSYEGYNFFCSYEVFRCNFFFLSVYLPSPPHSMTRGGPVRFDGLETLPLLGAPHTQESIFSSAQQMRRTVKLQAGDGA